MSNVTEIQTTPDELKATVEKITRMLPDQIKLAQLMAKYDYAKLLAYVAAGFKREEALALLKAEKIKVTITN